MAKLQLADSALHLDIKGHLFDVKLTPTFIESIHGIGERVKNVPITGGVEDVRAVGQWMSDTLDALLGSGAAQEIWDGDPNLLDFAPIIAYIMEATAEAVAAQNFRPVVRPMNRAQRRAVKPHQVASPNPVNDVEAAKAVLARAGYEFTD